MFRSTPTSSRHSSPFPTLGFSSLRPVSVDSVPAALKSPRTSPAHVLLISSPLSQPQFIPAALPQSTSRAKSEQATSCLFNYLQMPVSSTRSFSVSYKFPRGCFFAASSRPLLATHEPPQPISHHAIAHTIRHIGGIPFYFEPSSRRAIKPTLSLPTFSSATKSATRRNSRNSIPFMPLLHCSLYTPRVGIRSRHSPLLLTSTPVPATAPPLDALPGSNTGDPSLLPNPCSRKRFVRTARLATRPAAQACHLFRRKIPVAD